MAATTKITTGEFTVEQQDFTARFSVFTTDSEGEVATIWAGNGIDEDEAAANAEFVKNCFNLAQTSNAEHWAAKLEMHDKLVSKLKELRNDYLYDKDGDGHIKLSFDELLLMWEGAQSLISDAEKLNQ